MSKFNTKVVPETAVSYEGNVQYKKNALTNWFQFLFGSYLEDRFYENASVQAKRFYDLTNEVISNYGPEFTAKASLFARNELGMRSASEFVAGMLNAEQFEGKRNFYKNYYHRADGPSEVFSVVDMLGDKRSHALIRGTADYLSTLGDYHLTKYHKTGYKYNMFDIINLTHAHSDAIDRLKAGTAEKADTWERAITSSNSREENDANWIDLVINKKLGYLALIRNLNNIMSAVENTLSREGAEVFIKQNLIPQITDGMKIHKSVVFPYQIYTAYRNLKVRNSDVIKALDNAFYRSVGNMPTLDGESCIILDVSGSMDSYMSDKSRLTIKEVGACYACAFFLRGKTDFIKFGNYAKRKTYSILDSPFHIIDQMCDNEGCGYGTSLQSAFKELGDKAYDRLFIVSDFQTMGYSYSCFDECGVNTFTEYAKKYSPNCYAYSFDLGGYSSSALNTNNPHVFELTSLTDKLFQLIPFLEDGDTLEDYINSNYKL